MSRAKPTPLTLDKLITQLQELSRQGKGAWLVEAREAGAYVIGAKAFAGATITETDEVLYPNYIGILTRT